MYKHARAISLTPPPSKAELALIERRARERQRWLARLAANEEWRRRREERKCLKAEGKAAREAEREAARLADLDRRGLLPLSEAEKARRKAALAATDGGKP
jgi:hypothetical protein